MSHKVTSHQHIMEDTTTHLQSDREARIAARRKRIQERLAALREGENAGSKEGDKKDEIGKGRQQTLESRRKLLRLRVKTDADVSTIRVGGDDRENQHRIHEERMRQELRAKLLAEAEQSARQNAAVAMKWADLFSIEVPQELYQEIEKQRLACERIIASKDKLIHEIRTELKKKDDEYVKILKRQAEDVDMLLGYMSTQYVEMQQGFREELDEIENAFLQERATLLEGNRKEIEGLLEKRSKMENDFLERYLNQVESQQQSLEELRASDAEEYHVLKIRLESDIQALEQHLETMRATYQLNTEKLEYNYRVLVERDHENQSTINQQKRKVSRQRDVLSNLKIRYAETDRKYAEENMKLTDEYKRITEQFKDLQNKCRQFEAVDIRRFIEVWKMHQDDVTKLAKELLEADRVIHEQQLGLAWVTADGEAWVSPYSKDGTMQEGDGKEEEKEEDAAQKAIKEVHERSLDVRFFGALQLLVDEAGFLIESKVKSLLDRLPTDEQGMLKVDSILRALGVTDGPSFDALIDALTVNSDIELRAKGLTTRIEEDKKPDKGEGGAPVLVHPDDALRRLKAFVELESSAPSRGKGGKGKGGGATRRQVEKEQEYWNRMENIVSEKGFRVWNVLESQLDIYHNLLMERSEGLHSVQSLQQQNGELRALLNQYLTSRVNGELQIPPTQVI